MITFKDLKEKPELIKNITRLSNRPRYMWSLGRYDGVLSGICVYNDKPHYFECFKDYYLEAASKNKDRMFAVTELTDEQYLEEKSKHETFRDLVGWHSTYDENGKAYPRYPKFSSFSDKTPEELEAMTNFYFDALSNKTLPMTPKDLPVVAFWSDNDLRYKDSTIDREQALLLATLKDKIISLSIKQKDDKEERKKDNKYNFICWDNSRVIRTHLIAYTLLRGKSYNSMETHFKHEDETWYAKYQYKLKMVHEVIQSCGTNDAINKWSLEALEAVLKPSNESKVV